MLLRINSHSPRPIYEQIREQVHLLIETGDLKPGDHLPPVRQLAADLATAAATVARAYRELESDGVLKGEGRRGSVIIERRLMLSSQERTTRLQQAAEQFAAQARTLGASLDEALQTLCQIWNPEEQAEERS